MKYLLYFLLYVASLLQISAQNLNVASHEGIDNTGNMIAINSKLYYLTNTNKGCCDYELCLRGLHENGDSVFNISLPGLKYFRIGKVLRTVDDAIFLYYNTVKSCDESGFQDHIAKVDTNGTILFNVPVQSTITPGIFGIADITVHPDSSFYLVSKTELFHYSRTGQFVSKTNTGLMDITSVLALSNGNLFVNGKLNGAQSNVIITTSASILSQQNCLFPLVKIVETSSGIYARSSINTIEKYDTSLVLLASYNTSTNSVVYTCSDFTIRNDSIFIVGKLNPGDVVFYSILNSGLNVIFQSQSSYKGVSPTGIALNNRNNINVISTCNSKIQPNYTFKSFHQFTIGGGFNSVSDIGVIGFSNLNARLAGGAGGPFAPYLEMDVIVKNFGLDTVEYFYLNHYATWFPCIILLHKECKVTIAPGGTVSVPTGTFYGQPFNDILSLSSRKVNVCVFTTVPNESTDVEIDNDAFCDSLLFTVTGIDERLLTDKSVDIYPNPFNDNFEIKSEVLIYSYTIINALGKTIRTERLRNTKKLNISETNLVPGIYLININTEHGSITKKLIKQ